MQVPAAALPKAWLQAAVHSELHNAAAHHPRETIFRPLETTWNDRAADPLVVLASPEATGCLHSSTLAAIVVQRCC